MRQASAWVGCLVFVCSLACRGSALAPSGTGEARPTAPCSGTTCTITLKEADASCVVEPTLLIIESGNSVIFATQVSSQTAAVVITPKGPSPIAFQHGPPNRIDRGNRFDTGTATGAAGDTYKYNVRFVGPGNQNVCPLIDPVICIKPGGVEPGADECE